MSTATGYAGRLSEYDNKGDLNLRDEPDSPLALLAKARLLAEKLKASHYAVVHTGAGISTSCGIADFRGPSGVWTQQQQRPPKRPRTAARKPVSFEDAMPSLTHLVISALHAAGRVKYVISQNVDGLHLRSGLPRAALSELHGNLFMEACSRCGHELQRDSETPSVGLKPTGRSCPRCGGAMTDKALDWEDVLPEPDFARAKAHADRADLHIVAGTSCQMEPASLLPFRGARARHARTLVNLSRTRHDERFGCVIRGPCDAVFAVVALALGVALPAFERTATLELLLTAAPAGSLGGPRCALLVRRDDRLVEANVAGVRQVRYRLRDAATTLAVAGEVAGYRAVLPYAADDGGGSGGDGGERVLSPASVVAELRFARSSGVRARAQVCGAEARTVVTARVRPLLVAARLVRALRARIEHVDEHADAERAADETFVPTTRRGWAECAVCRESVWCKAGWRVAHARSECKRDALLRWMDERLVTSADQFTDEDEAEGDSDEEGGSDSERGSERDSGNRD